MIDKKSSAKQLAVSIFSPVNKGEHDSPQVLRRFEDYKEERSNLHEDRGESDPRLECQPSRCSREICLSGLMSQRLLSPSAEKRY